MEATEREYIEINIENRKFIHEKTTVKTDEDIIFNFSPSNTGRSKVSFSLFGVIGYLGTVASDIAYLCLFIIG